MGKHTRANGATDCGAQGPRRFLMAGEGLVTVTDEARRFVSSSRDFDADDIEPSDNGMLA